MFTSKAHDLEVFFLTLLGLHLLFAYLKKGFPRVQPPGRTIQDRRKATLDKRLSSAETSKGMQSQLSLLDLYRCKWPYLQSVSWCQQKLSSSSAGLGSSVLCVTTAAHCIWNYHFKAKLILNNETQDVTAFKAHLFASSQAAHSGFNPGPICSYNLCRSMNVTLSYTNCDWQTHCLGKICPKLTMSQ